MEIDVVQPLLTEDEESSSSYSRVTMPKQTKNQLGTLMV